MRTESLLFVASVLLCAPAPASAWGDEGHEIVAEIATHFMTDTARQKVLSLLAADQDPLTPHDLLSEATWADVFRDSDSNTTKIHYNGTRQWHFVNLEVSAPNLGKACFGMPSLPPGEPASAGPAADCAVDKIDQFAAELSSTATTSAERLLALKFLLHFVGDLHQPLHSSDENDAGGNAKLVTAAGLGTGTLHGFWDRQFVGRLGEDPVQVGDMLAAKITAADAAQWAMGAPADWATEAFALGKSQAYGKLPKPQANGRYALPASYVNASKGVVSLQLSRAGVRLAHVLNEAFQTP